MSTLPLLLIDIFILFYTIAMLVVFSEKAMLIDSAKMMSIDDFKAVANAMWIAAWWPLLFVKRESKWLRAFLNFPMNV